MTWLIEHWLAAVLFLAYAIVLAIHARTGLTRSKGIAGFLTGDRNVAGAVIGISFFATFASTNSYIGLAGKGYAYGLPWLIFPPLMLLFTWLSWRFVAPGLRRFTVLSGAVTVPEFLHARYDSRAVRVSAGLIIAASSVLYLVAIYKGAGHLFQTFLGIPYEAAIGLMLIVVMLYTTVGGFLSVVRTDVLQGSLMLVGSVLLFGFITNAAGGIGSIADLARNPQKDWLFEADAGIPFLVLLGITLAGSMKLLIDPRQVSRFYGLRDERSIKRGVVFALVGLLVIQFCLFPLGIYAHLLLDDVSETDLVIPTLLNDAAIVPVLVADFLVVAIVSAAMSSMDSVLLVCGSAISRDVIGPFREIEESRHVQWSRWSIVATAVIAAGIALNPPGGIVEITILSGSLYAICFVPTLVVALHWRRGSAQSALGCFASGILVLVAWRLFGLNSLLGVHEVFPALLVSCVSYGLVAWLTPAVKTGHLDEYFGSAAAPRAG